MAPSRPRQGTASAACTLRGTGSTGDLSFDAEFCVLELSGHEAILGMPWLAHFNPAIDWRAGVFTIQRPDGPVQLARAQPHSEEQRESGGSGGYPFLGAQHSAVLSQPVGQDAT